MHYTYYKSPRGERSDGELEVEPDAEEQAAELFAAGWEIDVEVLQHTGEASLTCCNADGALVHKIYPRPSREDDVLLHMRTVLADLVGAAHCAWLKRNRIPAAEWDPEKDNGQDAD